MNLFQLFKNIAVYVRPYKWLVLLALILTFIGALTAQVNAYVLQYTVNSITSLVEQRRQLIDGLHIVAIISVILLSKENNYFNVISCIDRPDADWGDHASYHAFQ